jgi:hypothetical protein
VYTVELYSLQAQTTRVNTRCREATRTTLFDFLRAELY